MVEEEFPFSFAVIWESTITKMTSFKSQFLFIFLSYNLY